MPQVIIAVVITLIITAVAVWFISTEYHKKVANTKIGNAEEQARGIIDEAVKNAEDKKREAMLEIKEETIRSKNEIERRSKSVEMKFSVTSVVLCRRKKIWTRNSKRLKSVRQVSVPKKKI